VASPEQHSGLAAFFCEIGSIVLPRGGGLPCRRWLSVEPMELARPFSTA
jgi:hypothetical protein